MSLNKIHTPTRHGVLGVYFCDEPTSPRFIVVVDTPRWVSVLSPYYETILRSPKKPDVYSISFSFHTLYAAMLSYPPFANAILATEKFSLETLMRVELYFPELLQYLNPLTIKLSYDYVTAQKQETQEP